MQLKIILGAQAPMDKLIRQELPLPLAYRLMLLAEKIDRHLRFYGQEVVKCKTQEDLDRLLGYEVEEFSGPLLTLPLDEELRLSARDIRALAPFIRIEEANV